MTLAINRREIECCFVADIHLSLKPPICRSGEPDWLETQAGYLKQLGDLADGKIPIVCSGDIFNRWDADKSPELINFAIDHLPVMYAIPGNHDLPNHQYDDLKKSAYWTLVQAGKIIDLSTDHPTPLGSLCFHARAYGKEPRRYGFPKSSLVLDIAVMHEYVWMKGCGYEGAKEETNLKSFRKRPWNGIDLVVLGDNHTTWYATKGTPPVVNPGGFMRRTVLEEDHKPCVWLLLRGKERLVPHYLDISKDVLTTRQSLVKQLAKGAINAEAFIKELRQDKQTAVCFVSWLKNYVRDNSQGRRVDGILMEILEEISK